MSRIPYEVLEDGWVAGVRVRAGDRLDLTPAEAKYARVAPVPDTPATGSAGRKIKVRA